MAAPRSPSRQQALADHVVELMADLGPVQARAMFGGVGLFWQGVMFALIARDQLYFKVDDQTVEGFRRRGLLPFTYESRGRQTSLSYWQAPPEVMDETAAMCSWGRAAMDCAWRQRQAAPGARRARVRARQQAPGDGAALGHLRNLGPRSQEMLARAGIVSEAQLRALGAVRAYAAARAVCPGASLNLLWALEGALSDRPWQEVAAHDRASLLMALEDVQRLQDAEDA